MNSDNIEVGDLVECTREHSGLSTNIQLGETFIALHVDKDGDVRYKNGHSLSREYCKLIKKAGEPTMVVTQDMLKRVEELNDELLALKHNAGHMTVETVEDDFTVIAQKFHDEELPFQLTWTEFDKLIDGNYLEEEEPSYEEEEPSYEEEESSYDDED